MTEDLDLISRHIECQCGCSGDALYAAFARVREALQRQPKVGGEYHLSAANLDALVNNAGSANPLAWAVKDLLLAHYTIEGQEERIQRLEAELKRVYAAEHEKAEALVRLTNEIAAKEAELERVNESYKLAGWEIEECNKQITRLRSALEQLRFFVQSSYGRDGWGISGDAVVLRISEALALPSPTPATFAVGDKVRVEHPRYHGDGEVVGFIPHAMVEVRISNGNCWHYEADTVRKIETPNKEQS